MTRLALAAKWGCLAASGLAESSALGSAGAVVAAPAARERRASRSIIARLPNPSVARRSMSRRVIRSVCIGFTAWLDVQKKAIEPQRHREHRGQLDSPGTLGG